jgi:hypothetical protein
MLRGVKNTLDPPACGAPVRARAGRRARRAVGEDGDDGVPRDPDDVAAVPHDLRARLGRCSPPAQRRLQFVVCDDVRYFRITVQGGSRGPSPNI